MFSNTISKYFKGAEPTGTVLTDMQKWRAETDRLIALHSKPKQKKRRSTWEELGGKRTGNGEICEGAKTILEVKSSLI